MNHFNQLTPAEAERLSLLLEEMGEAIQIIGKIQRHGYESYNPFDETRTHNRSLLEKEVGHVINAMDLMCTKGDMNRDSLLKHGREKEESVKPWLHHQEEESNV